MERFQTLSREQQKEHVLDKTNTAHGAVQLGNQTLTSDEKEFNKMLRRPRTRKFSKAVKNIDTPSLQDEALMERMKQEMNASADEDYSFTPEDMESFRQQMEEQIAEEIAREEERRNSIMQDIISRCGLTGCVIHSISPQGKVIAHYSERQTEGMDAQHKRAKEIVESVEPWTYVEIYPKKLVHRNEAGDTIKIYDVEE